MIHGLPPARVATHPDFGIRTDLILRPRPKLERDVQRPDPVHAAPPHHRALEIAGNISSSQLDQQEVDGIAAELKKGLDKPDAKPTEGVLQLRQSDNGGLIPEQGDQDTIYIDNDGVLHSKGDVAASDAQ